MAAQLPPSSRSAPPPTDTDVFSISDAHLAQRYQFIREIGAGNWGCVWLCSPKTDEPSARAQTPVDDPARRVAVKLVFREKKPTTAQRVRSLWNEMKIVRALKQDPHPSIIPFHSFIITPSFAIITMEYLPYLIPVEVPENKARGWFRSLLSAVHFLHCRGVVHNDIKPANILLSAERVPMLVDFGFAEKYELGTKRAFLSNLAYGTPEYLSPERARGNVHDTRKSDMWSLGVTLFEILIGRTPFEYVEGEKFTTPEDLERYWARTVKGKWVGTWKMSKSVERLLRRMIASDADARCTASDAMTDSYWMEEINAEGLSVMKNDFMTMSSPVPSKTPARVRKADGKLATPIDKENVRPTLSTRRSALSNVNLEKPVPRSAARPARRVNPYGLPTIEGSPLSPKTAARHAENTNAASSPLRPAPKARPSVKRKPVPAWVESPIRDKGKDKGVPTPMRRRRSGVLADASNVSPGTPRSMREKERPKPKAVETAKRLGSGSYDRVKAFEQLRQMERNRFLEEEEEEEERRQSSPPQDEAASQAPDDAEEYSVQEVELPPKPSSHCLASPSIGTMSAVTKVEIDERYREAPVRGSGGRPRPAGSSFTLMTDFKSTIVDRRMLEDEVLVEVDSKPSLIDSLPRSVHDLSPGMFKNGFKASFDKTFGLYKSSIGRMNSRTKKASKRASEDQESGISHRESWENDSLIRDAKTSLPIARYSLHKEQETADTKADRLSLWMRNVEQVVKEAKENFASSSITTPPPLQARPVPRPHVARASRPSRGPRKILAVDQIFQEHEPIDITSPISPKECVTPLRTSLDIAAGTKSPLTQKTGPTSPNRGRRATVSASPSLAAKSAPMDTVDGTPSKRKEKAKSVGNFANMVRPISPFNELQKELEKQDEVKPNLSELLDRSVFIARASGSTPPMDEAPKRPVVSRRPVTAQANLPTALITTKPPTTSGKLRESTSSPILSTPQRKPEGVYDRFLKTTTASKRSGRVSKLVISAPIPILATDPTQDVALAVPPSTQKKTSRLFGSRPSRILHQQSYSDDLTAARSRAPPDDFGLASSMSFSHSHSASFSMDASKSVNAVRKAFKAIVNGKSAVRRQPKVPV